jgi:Mg2+ and Co2+ transporter CorA
MPGFAFLDWRLAVILILISTVLSASLMYVIMKKKAWIPPKLECEG